MAFDRSHLLEQKIEWEVTQSFDTDADGTPDTSETLRVTTDNQIKWHTGVGNPLGAPITSHLGWRIDLLNTQFGTNEDNLGERVVANAILRPGHKIVYTSLLPSSDPCAAGGKSFLYELDGKDGSRLGEAPFDLNGDGQFDEKDYILLGRRGYGVLASVAPSGKLSKVGIASPPVIVSDRKKELKFSSGSTGGMGTTTENPGAGVVGRQAWRQLR